MINWRQARQLQNDVGKDEMVEVVDLFLSEVDEAMEALQNKYATMSATDRSAAFHFLKGCASNLGFETFGDKCVQGEESLKAGNEPDFRVSDLVETYARSKQQFAREYETELG
jgi:HPt (histidine-containing phosphotransfer) domain-containing protein